MEEKTRYVGSVRFYKNMLLVVIALLVLTLTVVSLYYHHRYRQAVELLEQEYNASVESILNLDSDPLAYQSLYEDFYAPQPYNATARPSDTAYLTFDGGPSENTAAILEILASEGVTATFFVNGNVAADPQYDDLLRAIVAGGHTLGLGSWSNDPAAIYASVEAYLADMSTLYTYIEETTGVQPSVFRFAGGSINSYDAGIYHELLAEMVRRGFVPYDWNLSADGGAGSTRLSAEELVLHVEDALTGLDRAIVLLHDDGTHSTTVEALPGIIALLQERAFSLSALTPEIKPVLFAYSN